MATLTEIQGLMTDVTMLKKVQAAVSVAAETARATPPVGVPAEATRKWVAQVCYEPSGEAQKAWRMMLGADGPNFTVAQITGLSDANLQSRVDTVSLDLIKMLSQL